MALSRRSLLNSSLLLTGVGAATAAGAGTAAAGTAPAGSARAGTAAAAAVVARMSLPQQVGQMIAAGVPFGSVGTAQRLMQWYNVGTIFLAGRTSAGVGPIAADNAALQTAATARTTAGVLEFVAVDQEGGFVQSLHGPGVSELPTALAQSGESAATIRYRAALWSRQLRRAGITLDLAPVTDVVPYDNRNANAPIGRFQREFGFTGPQVAAAVGPWVQGSLSAGVQPVLKHFPGLGRVTLNTDTSRRVVDESTTRSAATELPWRAGIAAGAGAIMVSNAVYARIDPRGQAFVSPTVIGGMIRRDLGFDGVVMTDDVGNAAAVQDVPIADRATRFVVAGGDLLLNLDPTQIVTMRNALVGRARVDAGFAARVRQSATRVVALKVRTGLAG